MKFNFTIRAIFSLGLSFIAQRGSLAGECSAYGHGGPITQFTCHSALVWTDNLEAVEKACCHCPNILAWLREQNPNQRFCGKPSRQAVEIEQQKQQALEIERQKQQALEIERQKQQALEIERQKQQTLELEEQDRKEKQEKQTLTEQRLYDGIPQKITDVFESIASPLETVPLNENYVEVGRYGYESEVTFTKVNTGHFEYATGFKLVNFEKRLASIDTYYTDRTVETEFFYDTHSQTLSFDVPGIRSSNGFREDRSKYNSNSELPDDDTHYSYTCRYSQAVDTFFCQLTRPNYSKKKFTPKIAVFQRVP
jgi:hypothetical protein